MEIQVLARYPFLTSAARYVENLDFSLLDVLRDMVFMGVRERGHLRVRESLEARITPVGDLDERQALMELLSYPVARMIVSCIKDGYLIRRYSLAEAKLASGYLEKEDNKLIVQVALDLGIKVLQKNGDFQLHFTDYLKPARTMQDPRWKLVNRRMEKGMVPVSRRELARLLQNTIASKIEKSLPLEVPSGVCKSLENEINDIQEVLGEKKSEYQLEASGPIEAGCFPPCISYLLASTQSGMNLAHSARFALTSFLLNIGMKVEDVIRIFQVSPDFQEDIARYQVEHIAGATGTTYTPPSCKTMKTYGNCTGGDKLCQRIFHPLSYYKQRLKEKNEETGGRRGQNKKEKKKKR